MLALKTSCERQEVVQTLNDMGLDQIARWIMVLPEDRWESMFLSTWPTLAKKCGYNR
ncbi:hypothetical protein ACFPES_34610 [Paenibacillus sp. GCM10023248]|uniref:hypothetical protein n=1 Tax=Bacillales TaxID=1385 RepID=UPI0023799E68|nr:MULTISPECIES: hypothetical protein [Bacillales]MDD9272163.1 hypothetical protein [Paenibacillus sp. MAHUQ-63]MDR6885332.1 hypothetical protein [Bacillus sp. 3255]